MIQAIVEVLRQIMADKIRLLIRSHSYFYGCDSFIVIRESLQIETHRLINLRYTCQIIYRWLLRIRIHMDRCVRKLYYIRLPR
ncbi:hypothetical protein D3C76_1757410 [compost metagenome]